MNENNADGIAANGYNSDGYNSDGLNKDGFTKWDVARTLLSNADRVTFDALRADGWSAELGDLLKTLAALSAA